jgi:hypothetical protein
MPYASFLRSVCICHRIQDNFFNLNDIYPISSKSVSQKQLVKLDASFSIANGARGFLEKWDALLISPE